jgi:hypothetical protein
MRTLLHPAVDPPQVSPGTIADFEEVGRIACLMVPFRYNLLPSMAGNKHPSAGWKFFRELTALAITALKVRTARNSADENDFSVRHIALALSG